MATNHRSPSRQYLISMAWAPGIHGGLVLSTTVFLVMPKALSGTLKVEMYDQEKTGSPLLLRNVALHFFELFDSVVILIKNHSGLALGSHLGCELAARCQTEYSWQHRVFHSVHNSHLLYSCSEKGLLCTTRWSPCCLASPGARKAKLNSRRWSSREADSFVCGIKEFQSWEHICFLDEGQALRVLRSMSYKDQDWALLLSAPVSPVLKKHRPKRAHFIEWNLHQAPENRARE